jgi:Putative zinc-finger
MTRCHVQASGTIELYFYDELDAAERASVEHHVEECGECAHALDELRMIRAALAARPDVAAPESGDWSAFMARLDTALARESATSPVAGRGGNREGGPRLAAYVAMAALLALVTVSVVMALRSRHAPEVPTTASADDARPPGALRPAGGDSASAGDAQNVDFETLSEEHFERSKLVVLGLATKDPADRRPSDWAYERELASSLLDDTRIYRLEAEDRGLSEIAGVMRDLEMVLLQTSMTDEKDPAALPQLQRLIQKRDLLGKMDAVAVPHAARTAGTKGI